MSLKEGEVLLLKDANATLFNIARVYTEGFKVDGKIMSADQLQQLLEPGQYITHSDGTLFGPSRGDGSNHPSSSHFNSAGAEPLQTDENDEYCTICALGGDLICCESCPATFHIDCIGLSEIPTDDWFCPACRCAHCGGASFDQPIPIPPPLRLPCSENSSIDMDGSQKMEPRLPEKLVIHHVNITGPKLYNIKPADPIDNGGDDNDDNTTPRLTPPLLPSPSHRTLPQSMETANKDAAGISGAAEVRCSTGGPRCHFACFTSYQTSEKDNNTLKITDTQHKNHVFDGYLSSEERHRAKALAESSCVGRQTIGIIRTFDSNTLPITFQTIHCASASESPCTGYVPDYSESESEQHNVQKLLSAALHILQASYHRIQDSRTGHDIIPLILRGASFAHTRADFSAMYAGILLVGSTVVAAACFRSLSDGIAEVPLLTVRPELRRQGLGELLLSTLEALLCKCGFNSIMVPAMIMPGWPLSPATLPVGSAMPAPMQSVWGYSLASRKDMLRLAKLRPLIFPGVYLCIKKLSSRNNNDDGGSNPSKGRSRSDSILAPRIQLPNKLGIASDVDVDKLYKNGFIELKGQGPLPQAPPGSVVCIATEQHVMGTRNDTRKREREEDHDNDATGGEARDQNKTTEAQPIKQTKQSPMQGMVSMAGHHGFYNHTLHNPTTIYDQQQQQAALAQRGMAMAMTVPHLHHNSYQGSFNQHHHRGPNPGGISPLMVMVPHPYHPHLSQTPTQQTPPESQSTSFPPGAAVLQPPQPMSMFPGGQSTIIPGMLQSGNLGQYVTASHLEGHTKNRNEQLAAVNEQILQNQQSIFQLNWQVYEAERQELVRSTANGKMLMPSSDKNRRQ